MADRTETIPLLAPDIRTGDYLLTVTERDTVFAAGATVAGVKRYGDLVQLDFEGGGSVALSYAAVCDVRRSVVHPVFAGVLDAFRGAGR